MRHQIRLADVENYIFEHQLAASYGREEHKELKAVMCGHNVHYEVWSFRERVFSGSSLADAVWAYNNE